MIIDYILYQFPTLVVLCILLVTLFANVNVRASDLLWIALTMICILSLTDYLDYLISGEPAASGLDISETALWKLRAVVALIPYILRPGVILIEVLIAVSAKKARMVCILLYIFNAAVYLYAMISVLLSTEMYEKHCILIHNTVFIVQVTYIVLLLTDAIWHLNGEHGRQNTLLLLVALLFGVGVLMEYCGLPDQHVTFILLVCLLMYHIYDTLIKQLLITQENVESKLQVERDKVIILRDQIQPHFIYNCLNIIRTLIRKDARAAVHTMDEFSNYLQAHFRAIQYDDLVMFEQELKNVKAYLALAQADYTKKFQIVYDLQETDFQIPPLSLEPLVENAVVHGIDKEHGVIQITTRCEAGNYVIRVSDNGTKKNDLTQGQTARVSVGIKNTRSRLAILCNGTLDVQMTENGTTSCITLPKEEGI